MHASEPGLLALHGLRVLGSPTAGAVAGFYGLDAADVQEHLLDAEATGLATRYAFDGEPVWSLTDRGRADNERHLAAELDAAGGRDEVETAHRDFLPLNSRLTTACTNWQVRPTRWDPLAANDHTDWRWDDRVMDDLASIARRLAPVAERLTHALARFGPHGQRFAHAAAKVQQGEREWIDSIDRPSCHVVWIQLHEDLIATLGLQR